MYWNEVLNEINHAIYKKPRFSPADGFAGYAKSAKEYRKDAAKSAIGRRTAPAAF
jgi:hypothetical protein